MSALKVVLRIFLLIIPFPFVTALLQAQAPTISFVGNVTAGQTFTVAGTAGDVLYVAFAAPGAAKIDCGLGFNGLSALQLDNGGPAVASIKLTAPPQSVKLSAPPAAYAAGAQVCLRAVHADGTSVYSPSPATVSAAVANVAFANAPASGATSISVQVSTAPSDLFVFDLPPNYQLSAAAGGDCTKDGKQTSLSLGAAGGTSQPIAATGLQTIQLTKPLVADDQLCVAVVPTGGGATKFTALTPISRAPAGVITLLSAVSISSNSVTLMSDSQGNLSIYTFDSGYRPNGSGQPCSEADLASGSVLSLVTSSAGGGSNSATSIPITANSVTTVALSSPPIPNAKICLVETASSGGAYTAFSPLTTITSPLPGTITILSAVAMNSSSVTFKSDTDGKLSIYLFGAGYLIPGESPSADPEPSCSETDLAHGSILSLVPTSGSSGSSSTATSLPVTKNSVTTVALSSPLTANTKICLVESASSGAAVYTAFSKLTSVSFFPPGSDYGRFGMSFTGGAVISNQQQSTSSTTAAQYLDAELTYDFIREGPVGLSSFLNIRSSTIPVTATTTTTQMPTSGSGTTPTLTQSLNALSSQQTIRVLAGVLLPVQTINWYRNQWLTLAPLFVGGFDTLLNPTPPTTPLPSTPTTLSSTAASYSSVYDYWAGGAELSWVQKPKSNDESLRTFAWFSTTVGNYSSLPSYVCTAKSASDVTAKTKFFSDPANPSTSCYVSSPSTNGTSAYQVYASRHLIPRIDVAGDLDIPNLPVVLGLDANLGQFSWRSKNLDILNKPGNDVRLFFGLRFNLLTALSKLGVPSQ